MGEKYIKSEAQSGTRQPQCVESSFRPQDDWPHALQPAKDLDRVKPDTVDRRKFLTSSLQALCAASVSLCLCGENSPSSADAQGKPRRQVGSSWDVEAREYLGTPQSEAAVTKGLAYLASRQQTDGHWVSQGYRNDVGINGLCMMAFLAAGHQPGRGRYGVVLSEVVDWLANSIQMNGQFTPPGLIRATQGGGAGPPMYGHGFALLGLAEVYGMTRRRDLKTKLQAAVKLIEDTQNQDGQPSRDGGWRYQPQQGDADLSVTVVQVLGLRGCRNAGIKVSQQTIDRAISYMKRLANTDGGFSYQYGMNQSNPARTGAGVLSLYLAGLKDSRQCQAGLDYLVKHPLQRGSDWIYRDHFHYSIYYVTQAMYQAGGNYWKSWYPIVRDRLVASQDADGSWGRADATSEAGTEYATAMACLVLQVPAGLLPIYQK